MGKILNSTKHQLLATVHILIWLKLISEDTSLVLISKKDKTRTPYLFRKPKFSIRLRGIQDAN